MPVSSVVPKAMFPLVDSRQNIRTVLHIILEETKSAGIECAGIVAAPVQVEMLQRYFGAVSKSDLSKLPYHIEYINQPSPKGFGDAVMQAADFIGDEPFMLLLGDHIHIEDSGKPPCAGQVAKAFGSTGAVAMTGMQPVSIEELCKVGVAGGIKIRLNIYRATYLVEKPDIQTARQKLVTNDISEDTFLGHCGIYIFSPEIFDCLSQVALSTQQACKEIELTAAQVVLLNKYPEKYFLYKIAGRAYDIGTPAGYANAQVAFRNKSTLL